MPPTTTKTKINTMEKTHRETSSLLAGWQPDIIDVDMLESEKSLFLHWFSGCNDQILSIKWLTGGHEPGDMFMFHIKCHHV